MRHSTVPINAIFQLQAAGDALINRPQGMPGIGILVGATGYGKTTATAWYCVKKHGIYVRAMSVWTPKTMLSAIAAELDIQVKGELKNNSVLLENIVSELSACGRPLFIDEADYVVEKSALVNVLRDIHDLSTAPIILVGMSGFEKKLNHSPQFTGRIARWVRFDGISPEDARLMADELCEVTVESCLLAKLYAAATPKGAETGCEVRRFVVGLNTIEALAKRLGLESISERDWPAGEEFFIGQAPALPISRGAKRELTQAGRA